MHRILIFILSFILISCAQSPHEAENNIPAIAVGPKSIPIKEENVATQILIPHSYRDVLNIDFNDLNASWLDLYFDKSEKKWKIAPSQYLLSRSFDECIGDSTTILSASRNPLILFTGIPSNSDSINALKELEETIPPERNWRFTFNNIQYKLSAMGSVINQFGYYLPNSEFKNWNRMDFDDYEIETYMLSLATEDGKSQLLFTIPNLRDGLVKLLWIGDLDQDGRPDFIFNTSTNKEEEKVELYLSTKAGKEDFVKEVAIVWIVFDC